MSMLAKRIRDTARITGTFTLRSGKTSDVYFDKYQFEAEPSLLLDIARAMVPLIPPGTEVLAGLEMGGIPIVTMLSQVTGLPCSFIRKEAKPYGTCRYAEGAALVGKQVVLVEDVVSSGGAILEAIEKLRSDSLNPTHAICVIDRETGGKEALATNGLTLLSLFTYSQVDRVA